MGTVTKSIGSGGGRDYSTLQAWEDALPANLVTDGNAQVGECYNDSEFTARVSIAGQTTDATNNITLRCASGQSFSDNTNKLTNRLAYNTSNGVAVRTTTAYASAVIVVTTNNVLIEGLQIKATGTQTWALNASGTANVVRKCILSAVSRNNSNDFVARVSGSSSNLIANCLVIADAANGCTGVNLVSGASAVNCTVVRPSNRTAGGKGFHAAYSTSTVKNCAIFGFSVSSTGTYASDGHNVTDHTSAPGSTSNITSATYANQFVQSSTGSSVEDFRVASTAALIGAGVVDTTNIPASDDIVGQARGTSWTVGCWQYVSAAIAARVYSFLQAVKTAASW